MVDISSLAAELLRWLDARLVDGRLPKACFPEFSKRVNEIWQARYSGGGTLRHDIEEGYRVLRDALGWDDSAQIQLTQEVKAQPGGRESFPLFPVPIELTYGPSKVAAVRKGLELMAAGGSDDASPPQDTTQGSGQPAPAAEFVRLAQEIIERIQEERDGEWWKSVDALAARLEERRLALNLNIGSKSIAAFLIATREGDKWQPEPYTKYLPVQHDDRIPSECVMVTRDPAVTAFGVATLWIIRRAEKGMFPTVHPAFLIDPIEGDEGGTQANTRHSFDTAEIADKAIITLRRWVRAVTAAAGSAVDGSQPSDTACDGGQNKLAAGSAAGTKPAEKPTPARKVKILFLAAMPDDQLRLRLDQEYREIGEKIRASKCRDQLELKSEWAVRVKDLHDLLLREKPHILHFSGHGAVGGGLLFVDDAGNSQPVSEVALSKLFRILKDSLRVVVLNACFSAPQAKAITTAIDCAVGMKGTIGDTAAVEFASAFYQALGYGRSVQVAFDLGCNALELLGIPEEKTPTLLIRRGVDAAQVLLTRAD
jgi:hypothetical protein